MNKFSFLLKPFYLYHALIIFSTYSVRKKSWGDLLSNKLGL